MTTHRDSLLIQAPRQRVFDLVADVERYPEFLPLWLDARVYEHVDDTTYLTEQEIGLGPLHERFRTKTVMTRPSVIEVTSKDGLFRDFRIRWTFEDAGLDGKQVCRANVALTWQVRSWLMQRAIDLVLPETARSMVEAFAKRADRIEPTEPVVKPRPAAPNKSRK